MASAGEGRSASAPAEITPVKVYKRTEKNRRYGHKLWFYVRVERDSLPTAWRKVFPGSTANDKSARDQCTRFLKFYEREYPPTFDMVANALGLNAWKIMRNIRLMMDANLLRWDNKLGDYVDSGRPDLKARAAGHDRLIKLVEKSEVWRRQFLQQDQERPTQLNLPPEAATFEEFEEWRKSRDILGEIERKRKEATEARNRRAAEDGQYLPPAPHVNGAP